MIETLPALAARQAAERPRDTACVEGEREYSFAEFDALGRKSAAWLRRRGVGPGDRVAVWLVNRIEWLALFFGLARIGACLVAVNTRFRAAELEYLLERSRARMLVCQPDFRKIDFASVLQSVNPDAARAITEVAVVGARSGGPARVLGKPAAAFDAFESCEPEARDDSAPEAVVAMFTTSGTTKGPKLVMHAQRSMVLHGANVARAHGMDQPGARLLAALPLCGVFGLDSTLGAFAGGAPAFLMDAIDATASAKLIARHAITHYYGSDEAFRNLLALVPGRNPFPSARLFGFAAMQPGALDFARSALAREVPITGLYGSSEVHALFSVQQPGLAIDERILAGGQPASAEAEVRVRDLDSGALAPPGGHGELEIRAPTNFSGYYDNPQASAEAIGADGFFRTGDIGYLREDGSFVYLTRRGDAIRLGGFLVNPAEIEDALARIASVREAQVVAVEIEGRMRSVAFVIPAASQAPTEREIVAAASGIMAGYKVPARVWFVEAFPVTPGANATKIQRGKLREMALARLQESARKAG